MNQAKGNFDGLRQAYTISANDQLVTGGAYRPLIVPTDMEVQCGFQMWRM